MDWASKVHCGLLCSLALLGSCKDASPNPEYRSLLLSMPSQNRPVGQERGAGYETITDVFSFGSWRGMLSDRQGRCVLTFDSFTDNPQTVEQVLDLSAPCYVSRWSSVVPRSSDPPKAQARAHGGPGDAQVWQLGTDPVSKIFVTSIVGFDTAMGLPEDRSLSQLRDRCSNAQQPIRLQGRSEFSLGEPTSSPTLSHCALQTVDLKRFAIDAEDLFPRHQNRNAR